jgi:Protein of unknown function (DUF3592)
MPGPSSTIGSDDAGQVRGVSTKAADPGLVLLIVAGLAVLVLLGLAAATTVSAANQNSNLDMLRRHGVPVQATVTACEGIGSGIGMGISYYDCRATYTLDGRSYNEIIGGSRSQLPVGQVVSAVAVPGHPSLLSTTSAVQKQPSHVSRYVTSIILWVVTVLGGLGVFLWWRRLRRRHANRPPSLPTTSGAPPGEAPAA